jgi:hypothetical protein
MGLPVEITPALIGSSSYAVTGYQVSRSLRFRSSASATVSRTPSVTGNRRTFTFSAWVKRGKIGTTTGLLMAQQGTSNGNLTANIGFGSDDKLSFDIHTNSTLQIALGSTASVFRDPSAWYHIVFAVDTTQASGSDGVKVYVNGVQQTLSFSHWTQNADSAYNTANYTTYFARSWSDGSINSYADCYMAQVYFIDGQQLTPSSFGETNSTTGIWQPKAYSGSYGTNGFYLPFTDNTTQGGNLALYSSTMNNSLYSSTWLLGPNSTQVGTTTAPDGSSNAVTYTGTGSGGNQYLGQVVAFGAATTYTVSVWAKLISGSTPTSGQIITSEYNNGSSTVRSAVNYNGNLTSSWKRFSTTFTNVTGGNYNVYFAADQNTTAQIAIWGAQIEVASSVGPYYPATSSAVSGITKLGADYSTGGNWSTAYNNFSTTNISLTAGATYDSMIDVPTNYDDGSTGRGNYAVMNKLAYNSPNIIDGNLTVNGGDQFGIASMGMSSGKWYMEATIVAVGGESCLGISKTSMSGAGTYVGYNADGWGYISTTGNKINTNSFTAYGSSYTTNDVMAIAFDADNGTLVFYKNGVSQGTAFSGLTSGPYFFAISGRSSGGTNNVALNFGQKPFIYTPPTGYKALNTQNLPTPTIVKGNAYMDATLYTGTGAALTATNSGSMQPDLLWLKNRSLGTGGNHTLFDSVRGGPSTELYTSSTAAESAGTGALTSLNANGFTLGNGGDLVRYNQNTNNYVAWQWKKGATPGFDIVTYTGSVSITSQTISHSLGVKPSMIVVKSRNLAGRNWPIYHTSIGATNVIYLNATNASSGSSGHWNNTEPTSTNFTVGTDNDVNANGGTYTYVAYLWAEVAGFSRFGSYTGNGSTDGPFVWCGFRPKFVLIKASSTGENWNMFDSVRSTYNVVGNMLLPNSTNAEYTDTYFDMLSNGIKFRNSSAPTGAGFNTNGVTYTFAAFAENPFKYALAR